MFLMPFNCSSSNHYVISLKCLFVDMSNANELCERCVIGTERKLASAGSEQTLIGLLSNSMKNKIGFGWLREDFG